MARRLRKDVGGERSVGRLRLIAAVISTVAVLWLLVLTDFGWPAIALALVVVLAARFWARSWVRTERAAANAAPVDLVLDETGMQLGERALPWRGIARVELDHDRLLVRVVPVDGEPLELEPPYEGLGLEALGRAIEDARRGRVTARG